MNKKNFWKGKKVFITGHTGFKGSWLSIWLKMLGAKVYGYSLNPPTKPSIYHLARLDQYIDKSYIRNIQDINDLKRVISTTRPNVLFHLAAQTSVRYSYKHPIETIKTNIIGSSNLLEAIKNRNNLRSVVMIATDKVYENYEKKLSFKETHPLGGKDIYSVSKASSELIVNAYRHSFFSNNKTFIASARSGNVIGGGDWTKDRIVPDCLNAFIKNQKLTIRYPNSIRPWQHVLEPLHGYLILAQKLYSTKGSKYAQPWNFGPTRKNTTKVIDLAKKLKKIMNSNSKIYLSKKNYFHETKYLSLDSSKSRKFLKWEKFLNLDKTLKLTVDWFYDFKNKKNLRETCIRQIKYFTKITNG